MSSSSHLMCIWVSAAHRVAGTSPATLQHNTHVYTPGHERMLAHQICPQGPLPILPPCSSSLANAALHIPTMFLLSRYLQRSCLLPYLVIPYLVITRWNFTSQGPSRLKTKLHVEPSAQLLYVSALADVLRVRLVFRADAYLARTVWRAF